MLERGETWIRDPAKKAISASTSLEDCFSFFKTHLQHRSSQPIVIIDAVDELSTNKEGDENRRPLIDKLLQLPIRLLITGTSVLRGSLKQRKILEIHVKPSESDVSAFVMTKILESGKLLDYAEADALINAIVDNMWKLLPEKYV